MDSLPDMILPGLAYVASRRHYIPHAAVQAVVTYCGPLFLERCLERTEGANSSSGIQNVPRFPALFGTTPEACEIRNLHLTPKRARSFEELPHDQPISLKAVCEIAFDNGICPATLKAEHKRGNLDIFKIGRASC